MLIKTEDCIHSFNLNSRFFPRLEKYVLSLKKDGDSLEYKDGETIVSLSLDDTELRLLIERLKRLRQEGGKAE